MSMRDVRGVPTSTDDPRAHEGYEQALRLFQRYRGDPLARVDRALDEAPDFVMGHVLRAMLLLCMWEESVYPEVRKSLHRLEALGNGANDRERSLIAAICDWVDGEWERMRGRLDRHLADFPCDALALQVGHLADFIHGDRDNLRGRIVRALPAWDRTMPGYGFVLGMSAFGHEECGDYDRAEDAGRLAVSLEPEDCWAHHAVTHVMEMQGRQADGIAWMEERQPHWAQADNVFSYHNWWHFALYHLDQGEPDRALALFDDSIRPRPSHIQMEMVDAAALLWRLHLQGIDVGDRWVELAETYDATNEPGFYVFNDMHAMMACVAAGRGAAADRLLERVTFAAAGYGTNAAMTRAVGLALVRAVHAFGRGAHGEAVDLLMPVRYRAHAFGGSHAQRDIIHRTLLEAALRDGQGPLALALAHERAALKPKCPFVWAQVQRAKLAHAEPVIA